MKYIISSINDYLKNKANYKGLLFNSPQVVFVRQLIEIYGEENILNSYQSKKKFIKLLKTYGYQNPFNFITLFNDFFQTEQINQSKLIKQKNPYFTKVQKEIINMYFKKGFLQNQNNFFNILFTNKANHPLIVSYNYLTSENELEHEKYFHKQITILKYNQILNMIITTCFYLSLIFFFLCTIYLMPKKTEHQLLKNVIIEYKHYTNNYNTIDIYEEELLNGATPELSPNMIPVIYEDGMWKSADLTKELYNYEKLRWANAVIVKEDKYDYYAKYSLTPIDFSDIYGFFVWIPRFEYQLFNVGYDKVREQMINVRFVNASTPKKTYLKNGEYYTHPAFTATYSNNLSYELNGFWIAKFEPSLNSNKVEFKPQKKTIVNLNMADMWEYATNIDLLYSLSLNSRIITNMEWGAIAYFSYSQYGKLNNDDYQGKNKNIFLNTAMGENWENIETGCSSGRVDGPGSFSCPYNYDVLYYGTGASSTGTIYGIYDLAGGSWECVIGLISCFPIRKNIGGYNGTLYQEKRYYTLYNGGTMHDYNRGLIGDATRETLSSSITNRSWNGNLAYFATPNFPWIKRGGSFRGGSNSGLFDYGITDALPRGDKTFRVILSSK
ncbi:MAG: hypothetical protein E7172_00970 [Firmicutes bacterium]|nr:hypothetical protein [Bacillota bacterium]